MLYYACQCYSQRLYHEQWHCYLFCDSQSKVIRKQLESLPPKLFFGNKGLFRSENKNEQ